MLSCEGGSDIGEFEISSRDFLLNSFSRSDDAGFFLLPSGVMVLTDSSAITPDSGSNLFEVQIFSFGLCVVRVRDA